MNPLPTARPAEYEESEIDAIMDSRFLTGSARCPSCQSPMTILPRPMNVSYMAVGSCNGCGRRFVRSGGRDPLLSSFRPFSPDEKSDLLAAAARDAVVKCPVDGSLMTCNRHRDESARFNYYLSCPRCSERAVTPLSP